MKIQHREDYRVLRARDYPNIGDQLDAIMKLASALQQQGIILPIETQNWINECLAVKAIYKKA